MNYLVAERFKSVQGEGVWAGTPMAFIRFVGCSVGKKVCHACDTAFEKVLPWQGGGEYTAQELNEWVGAHNHVCLTGGEPLDQELYPLLSALGGRKIHIETSGTKVIPADVLIQPHGREGFWICVCPKPGYIERVVETMADEVKIIVPGLGSGEGWPTLQDALRWAGGHIPVFLQPRNGRQDIDPANLALCQQLVLEHPQLRLSVQLHKLLRVR